MQTRMQWDDVATFLAVVRAGSLSGAAKSLEVHVSTVHRRMRTLESDLDAVLLERRSDGIGLTAYGEAMVEHAERMEADAWALERAVCETDIRLEGTVRLTLPEAYLGLVAPELAALKEELPGITVDLRADARVYDLGREADIALRPGRPHESAVGTRVGTESWCRYGTGAQWVVYGPDRHGIPAARWRRRAHPDVPILTQVSDVSGMHRVLTSVEATGLLPCLLGDPDLARVGEPIEEVAVAVWLLIHADLRRSPRVRAVVDGLVPRLRVALQRPVY